MRSCAITAVFLLTACAGSQRESPSESTTPPGNSGQPQLDSTALDVGMERIRPLVTSCLGPSRTGTTWNVRLTIRNDGHPTTIRI